MRIRHTNESNTGHISEKNPVNSRKTKFAEDEVGKPGSVTVPVDEKEVQSSDTLKEDVVEISEQARKSLNGDLEEMGSYYSRLNEELARAREQGDGMAEMMKEKIMCLRIAMRIMSGNKVPKKDHKYLMEKDPELYARASMMKLQNKDRKELDRLTEDEEEKKVEEGESGRGEASPIESAEVQPETGEVAATEAAAEPSGETSAAV